MVVIQTLTLKFEKIIEQVQRMGRSAGYRNQDISERGQLAIERLLQATDLQALHDKIDLVRERDAGYRGAAPFQEDISLPYPCQAAPAVAHLVAVDGSQVYPDLHAPALYYVVNVGTFVYQHGTGELPQEESVPELFYTDPYLRERNGHGSLIKNAVVNARRDVKEIQTLTIATWQQPDGDFPVIGFRDGRLLWWLGQDIPHAQQLEAEYHQAIQDFYDIHRKRRKAHQANVSLVGYVDSDDSRFVIRLLHLIGLPEAQITRAELDTAGPFEGLTDGWLFSHLLEPRERSAVMIQQSPQNKNYKLELGDPYEIAFFYLNVGSHFKPHVVRIEIPLWVAKAEGAVAEVQSLILAQCAITGGYPYVLTRADELAVITASEKNHLENLIKRELLNNQQPVDESPKAILKDLARAARTRYRAN